MDSPLISQHPYSNHRRKQHSVPIQWFGYQDIFTTVLDLMMLQVILARRSLITKLAYAGIDLNSIRQIAGHSSISTTQRYNDDNHFKICNYSQVNLIPQCLFQNGVDIAVFRMTLYLLSTFHSKSLIIAKYQPYNSRLLSTNHLSH